MNKFLLTALVAVFSLSAIAQNKLFTIQDAAGMNFKFYTRGVSGLQWVDGTDWYSHMPKGDSMVVVDASTQKLVRSITLNQLNEWMNWQDSLKRFPQVKWHQKGTAISFPADEFIYTVNLSTQKGSIKMKLPKGYSNLEWYEHNGKWNCSYKHNDILHVNNSAIHQKEDEITYGESVHRNEFGISGGIFWSRNAEKMAFYRNDESAVNNYPMTTINGNVAESTPIKYPMAGQANEVVKLGVYHASTGKTVYLKTGDVDQYLTNITWGPESKHIFVAVLNRGQDHLKWQQYDAETGELVRTLFEEKSEQFVEPLHQLYFIPGTNFEYIWLSWKDGFTTLHHYSIAEGYKGKMLTKADWEVTGILGFSQDGETVYFTGTGKSPLESHLWSASTEKYGKPEQLTKETGTHSVQLSPNGNYFIDVYSNRQTPLKTLVKNTNGKTVAELDEQKDPMADYVKVEMDFFTIKAADDKTDLHCRVIKPHDFDKNKKYPAIVYVYGGPHAQMVSERWMGGASFFLQYLAQQGFVVFTVDSRGSDNRGRDFEQCTHRKMGEIEMADQMKGVEWLKSQKYIDSERIGVHGWSYGGYMTTSLMLNQPDVFKVGVCGGPVIDWKFYEIMYTERYMDTPQENPEGYEQTSLLNEVENLKGKLLIVHGTNDDVVVLQHTLAFIEACANKGVLFDYFPYPGGKHHWGGPARVHLMMKMAQYFKDNL
ncbi:MAG: DPP IV N-terminal domain-containing protein [Bacteroidetes bacterium]|nr:DPP IV N-terminal domain-containing protein [Bacteroidota bacterium]